jgi:hypothetical protein
MWPLAAARVDRDQCGREGKGKAVYESMSFNGGRLPMETHTAIYAIPEIIIILMGVACIVWLIWPVREDKQGSGKAALDQAWREVLDDAYDMERRHFEERKRVEDYQHKRIAAAK